jgi:hypothetical protein
MYYSTDSQTDATTAADFIRYLPLLQKEAWKFKQRSTLGNNSISGTTSR